MIEFRLKWNAMSTWLCERADVLFSVKRDTPEGKIKNRFWVETREWDKD